MLSRSLLIALMATAALAAPLKPSPVDAALRARQSKVTDVASSFSPSNFDSPGADSITLDPTVALDPTINLRQRQDSGSEDTCVGSSFSPANCNSPGADSVNVAPTVDVDPTVTLRRRSRVLSALRSRQSKVTDVASSFSPSNFDSPGADSPTVDPTIDISPTIGKRRSSRVASALESRQSKVTDVASSFSPSNFDSPGADSATVSPTVDVSPTVGKRRSSGVLSALKSRQSKVTDVASSFSPSNFDSSGADSPTVDPTLDLSPTISVRDAGEW